MPYDLLAQELFDVMDPEKHRLPNRRMDQVMRGEMAVLRLLSKETAPMTAGDISRRLRMTTSRIAAVLGSLEKKGMILREADSSDKRRVQVVLTDKGGAFCLRKREQVLADITHLLTQLGHEDVQHFVRIMGRIHQFTPPTPRDMNEPHVSETDKEGSADEQ